jgi:hypothetical protein
MTRWVLLAGCGAMMLAGWTLAAPPGKKGDSAEVKALLKKRRDVLKEAAEAGRKQFLAGLAGAPVTAELARELLKAELELATTDAQRVAAHEAYFEAMRELEKIAKGRFDAGRLLAT